MKILITGGTGFIGSYLVKSLISNNHNITIVGNFTEAQIPKGVKLLQLNFNGIDWDYLKNNGIDAVFHQGANNNTQDEDLDEMLNSNYYASCDLFENLAEIGCTKFIYASSTAVYGNSPSPYVENETELLPLTPYGLSKKLFDEFAMEFAKNEKIIVIGLRYSNVYGANECHKGKRASMIYQIANCILNGQPPVLFKNGEQKRDWIYVKDVVDANLWALENKKSAIYNCASGTATSFLDLVNIINGHLFWNPSCDALNPIYIDNPYKDSYQNLTCCNIDKIKNDGFIPKWDIVEGIKDMLNELKKNPYSNSEFE